MRGVSFCAAVALLSEECGVLRATLGIDFAAMAQAPALEFERVEGDLPEALLSDALAGQLGADVLPEGLQVRGSLVVADGGIGEEILFVWPKHGDDRVLHGVSFGCDADGSLSTRQTTERAA